MARLPTITITQGLPASGKTQWAEKQRKEREKSLVKETEPHVYGDNNTPIINICKDDIRRELYTGTYKKDKEPTVIETRNERTLKAIDQGQDVIISDTNLNPTHIRDITKLTEGKANIQIKDFTNVPLKTCIERDLKRKGTDKYVGEEGIINMYNKYLKAKKENISNNLNGAPCYIFDIDGTLALFEGLRSPYDTASCINDIPNKAVIEILQTISDSHGENFEGYSTILVSGRSDEYKKQTEQWLEENEIPYDFLFMRKKGDTRSDETIKLEIYKEQIRPHYNVLGVFDDRLKVLRMWQSIGLFTFNVQQGFKEF